MSGDDDPESRHRVYLRTLGKKIPQAATVHREEYGLNVCNFSHSVPVLGSGSAWLEQGVHGSSG